MSAQVTVRYWAAARSAAGLAEEMFEPEPDLGALLEAVRSRHGADGRLADVLRRCSYLVDEVSPGRRAPADVALLPGSLVDVLPPFAGGSAASGCPSGAAVPGTATPSARLALP
jgi:sulfur-carrier protein